MLRQRLVVFGLMCGMTAAGRAGVVSAQNPAVDVITDSVVSFTFPPKDPTLQLALDSVLAEAPFTRPMSRGGLSVVLVDLSTPGEIRYAGVDENRMRYSASLPKIAVMLTVFAQIEQGALEYTPDLRNKLERMIRRSENRTASQLISLVGFETIAEVLRDPHYELYDLDRRGGLWVGKGYGGLGIWRRDPMSNLSHGATARQVARFLVMLERGLLVSPWASSEMKRIMGNPGIEHKFVLGLRGRSGLRIFRKSGTYRQWHADAAIVEHGAHRYVAVALLESTQWRGVLSTLIGRLDDLIMGGTVGTSARPQ